MLLLSSTAALLAQAQLRVSATDETGPEGKEPGMERARREAANPYRLIIESSMVRPTGQQRAASAEPAPALPRLPITAPRPTKPVAATDSARRGGIATVSVGTRTHLSAPTLPVGIPQIAVESTPDRPQVQALPSLIEASAVAPPASASENPNLSRALAVASPPGELLSASLSAAAIENLFSGRPAAAAQTHSNTTLILLESPAPDFAKALCESRGCDDTIVVNISVAQDGRVTKALLAIKSRNQHLNQSVLAAVANWRYLPMAEPAVAVVTLRMANR